MYSTWSTITFVRIDVDATSKMAHGSVSAQTIENLERTLAPREHSSISKLTASVSHGTVRAGHGLLITLKGLDGPSAGQTSGWLDVHGDAVFNALPYGLGTAAQMLLPLSLRMTIQPVASGFSGNFVLGAKNLSHTRVDQVHFSDIIGSTIPAIFWK